MVSKTAKPRAKKAPEFREEDGWLIDAEEWRSVGGYEGAYEISSFGRVRSLNRVNINRLGVRRILRGKVLRLSCDSEGYSQVGLLEGGIETKMRIHRLVATAFIPNPSTLPLVDHRNRDRKANHWRNLRWASFSDNRKNTPRLADMKRLAGPVPNPSVGEG